MDERLKKRLIGATVLVSLAVIFVPMLLEREPVIETGITESNIPPKPESRFSSRIIPLESDRPEPAQGEVAKVERVVPEAKKPEAAVTPGESPKQRTGLSAWVIQVGSFSNKENADNLVADLRKEQYPAFLDPATINGNTLFRVKVGPEVSRDKAEQMLEKLNASMKPKGLKGELKSYP